MGVARTENEIQDQIGRAMDNPGQYPGMSYEEGVQAALDWVTGHTDEVPMPEE